MNKSFRQGLVFGLQHGAMRTVLTGVLIGTFVLSVIPVDQSFKSTDVLLLVDISCCRCWRRLDDGTRFYMGIIEQGYCYSYPGGFCTDTVPCFGN